MCINCGGNLIFLEHIDEHEDTSLLSNSNTIVHTEIDAAASFDPITNAIAMPEFAPTATGASADAGTATGSGDVGYNKPIVSLQTLANFLESGYWGGTNWKWGVTNISYNLQSLTADEQNLARQAFHAWSSVANLTFSEVTSGGAIQFVSPATGGAFANFSGSGSTITSATVSISEAWMTSYYNSTTPFYNYAFQTYIHEIGHALGLGHQGAYNGSAVYDTDNNFANDSWQFSVMSYFSQNSYNYNGAGASYVYVSGPMQADIVAMQDKYGAPGAIYHYYGDGATKGSEFEFANGVRGFTLYSPDGWAALDSHVYGGSQTIDMRAGAFSSVRGYTNNIGNASNTNMTEYYGGGGADTVDLSYYGTYVSSGGGNDVIRSRGTFLGSEVSSWLGNNIDGGAGFDTFVQPNVTRSYVTFNHTNQSSNGWTLSGSNALEKLSNVEVASFTDMTVTLRQAHSNFNFGGTNDSGATSDVLLQNGGTIVNWSMQGNSVVAGAAISGGALGWTVAATGDFNADGVADIILQNGGTVVSWGMSNGAINTASVLSSAVAGWTVKSAADFNNDGTQDLVLQSGGNIVTWTMQNGAVSAGNLLASGLTGWNVVGTGDFYKDGSSDILLQNGGTFVLWNMVNGSVASGTVLGSGLTGWSIKGTGDLNGDGTTDIVLQNGTSVVEWLVNNGAVTAGNLLGAGAGMSGWNVVAVGDYNGDGTSDVMLQNGGTIVDWTMTNGAVTAGSLIATGSTGWLVVA